MGHNVPAHPSLAGYEKPLVCIPGDAGRDGVLHVPIHVVRDTFDRDVMAAVGTFEGRLEALLDTRRIRKAVDEWGRPGPHDNSNHPQAPHL